MIVAFDQRDPFGDIPITNPPQRRPNPRPLIQAGPPQVTPNQDAASGASAAASAAGARRTTALTPEELRALRLENDAKEAMAARGGLTAEQADQRARYTADLDALGNSISRLGQRYRRDFEQQDPWISLGLSDSERAFDQEAETVRQLAQGLFRVPGSGGQSDVEFAALQRAYGLASGSRDVENEGILDALTDRLNARRRAVGLDPVNWRQQDGAWPSRIGAAAVAAATAPNRPGEITRTDIRESAMTGVDVPAMRNDVSDRGDASEYVAGPLTEQYRNTFAAMVRNPRITREQIDAFTQEFARAAGRQVAPMSDDVWNRVQTWRRRGGPLQIGPTEPMDRQERSRTVGDVFGIESNADSDLTAGIQRYAGAMGGDLIGLVSEDYRDKTRALQQRHPGASLVGDIAGSLLPTAQAQRAIGRIGAVASRPMLRYVPQLGSNVAYSGAQAAALADPEDRLTAGLIGGGAGLAGDVIGGRVAAGAGRALTGARNASVRYLNDRGIPLTVGQIANGGGLPARVLTGIENRLESLPYVGDAIRARRMDSFEGVNRAAFDDALEPIGANTGGVIGEEGVGAARTATGAAYNRALDGVNVRADQPFVRQMSGVLSRAERLPPDLKAHFDNLIENRVGHFMSNGQLSGDAFQALRQEIRQAQRAIRGQLSEGTYGGILKQTERALEQLVRRQAPDVVPALNQADRAFRRTQVVRGAVSAGKNQGGVFTPAQLGTAAEQNARRFGGEQGTTDRPFFELQRNAQNVLPSRMPNSGTTDRAWLLQAFPALAGGVAYQQDLIDPKTAALFGALGLPYTRAGAQTLQKLLVSRPERVRQIGEQIIAQRRWGSRVGAGGSDAAVDQTSPPPGY